MESCRSRLEIKPGMQCSDLASIAHTTNSLRMVCARKVCRPRVAYTSRSTRGARSASDGNRIQSNLTGYSVSDRAVRGSSSTGAGALRERWRERGRRGDFGCRAGKRGAGELENAIERHPGKMARCWLFSLNGWFAFERVRRSLG